MDLQTKTEIDTTNILSDAIKNSEILLSHATEHGIELEKVYIKTLVETKHNYRDETLTKEEEIEFWVAYKVLSKLIQPVSIDSLQAAQERKITKPNIIHRIFKKKHAMSLSHKSVRVHTVMFLIAMVSMLAIQIYSLKGTTLLNTIQTSNKRMKEIEFRLNELMLILAADKENQTAILEKESLENEQYELDRQKTSSIELLEPWVKLLNFITRLHPQKKEILNPNDNRTTALGPPTSAAADVQNDKISIIQEAQNYILILGLYILPLLYGLLGGFAYVLRSLADETKSLLFSKESNIKYTLRIHLGALAGLAIGLFWGDLESQQVGFIESLSPLALAFVAGYSIEFLFMGIDRVISSVSKK